MKRSVRKQQILKLTIFLEPRKTKSSGLKVFPPPMKLLNSLLQNLRRNFGEPLKFLVSFWQVVKLAYFGGELR